MAFGLNTNCYITALDAFKDDLYALTVDCGASIGAQIWRCHLCDGSDWSKVVDGGYGNPLRTGRGALNTFGDHLYWVTRVQDNEVGMEVLRSER